jgi:hypothetical protein
MRCYLQKFFTYKKLKTHCDVDTGTYPEKIISTLSLRPISIALSSFLFSNHSIAILSQMNTVKIPSPVEHSVWILNVDYRVYKRALLTAILSQMNSIQSFNHGC